MTRTGQTYDAVPTPPACPSKLLLRVVLQTVCQRPSQGPHVRKSLFLVLPHMEPPANYPLPPVEASDQKKALNEFSELGLPNGTSRPIDFPPELLFLLLLLPHLAQAHIQGVVRAEVRVHSSVSEGLEILSGYRGHFKNRQQCRRWGPHKSPD